MTGSLPTDCPHSLQPSLTTEQQCSELPSDGNLAAVWSSGPGEEVQHQAREHQDGEDRQHQEEHQECPQQGEEQLQASQPASQEGLSSLFKT